MTAYADLVLLAVVMIDLFLLATSRLGACIRASALQGVAFAALPFVASPDGSTAHLLHAAAISLGTLLLKALLIPWWLLRALRRTGVRREVEPFVSLHLSLVLGAALAGLAFWTAAQLPLPRAETPALLVPTALTTLLFGFLIVVSRRKALTQVVGYLLLENGVFVFGLSLAREMPFVVELGILLDVLVGVFVFGLVIRHLNAEIDSLDVGLLSELRD